MLKYEWSAPACLLPLTGAEAFELTSPKVSISLRFPIQKKGFSLFSQWIVYFSSLVRPGKFFRNCLTN